MPQLILESENESTLKLIQTLAEQMHVQCQFILQKTKNESIAQTKTQTEGERILAILENSGLLGCMKNAEENLSENYKQHLWNEK